METYTVYLVRPPDCNHYGHLCRGAAIAWMDKTAFITAMRYARCKVVTAHRCYRLPPGYTVELVAWVTSAGRSFLRPEWIEPIGMEGHKRVE